MAIQKNEMTAEEFFDLLVQGDIEALCKCDNIDKYLNARNRQGKNPLHIASEKDRVDIIQFLYESDKSGNKKIFQAALEARTVDQNSITNHYLTPLLLAVKNGSEHAVQELLQKGANAKALTNNGGTALHLVRTCTLEMQRELKSPFRNIVIALLDKEISPQTTDHKGVTALAAPVNSEVVNWISEYYDLLENLRNAKAEVNYYSQKQQAADEVLVKLSNEAKNSYLKNKPASTSGLNASMLSNNQASSDEIKPSYTYPPDFSKGFREAIDKGDMDALKGILNLKDFLVLKYEADKNALHIACEGSNQTVLEHLCKEATPEVLEAKHSVGYTPLMIAVMNDQVGMANILISRGADIDTKTNGNYSLLHNAVRYGASRYMIKTLLDAGVDHKATDESGKRAVDYADDKELKDFINGYLECKTKLEESKQKIETFKKEIETSLFEIEKIKKINFESASAQRTSTSQLGRGVYSNPPAPIAALQQQHQEEHSFKFGYS